MISAYVSYFVFIAIFLVFIPYQVINFLERGKRLRIEVSKVYRWSARGLVIRILGLLYSFGIMVISLLTVVDTFNLEQPTTHPLLGVCIFAMIITALIFCTSILYRKALV